MLVLPLNYYSSYLVFYKCYGFVKVEIRINTFGSGMICINDILEEQGEAQKDKRVRWIFERDYDSFSA
jgi:hypothetical protein